MKIDHDNHDEIAELAAAYALGALDEEETRLMDQHVPTCEQCSRAVEEMRQVVNALPYSVAPMEPPAELKQRVLDRIHAEPREGPAEGPAPTFALSRPSPPAPREGFWSFFLRGALPLAAAVASLVVLAISSALLIHQHNQIASLQAQVAQQAAVQQILLSSSAQTQPVKQGNVQGTVLMAPDSKVAYLVIKGLPAISKDRDYQVWLKSGNQLVSAGVFHPNGSGTLVLHASDPMKNYQWIGITQEPSGGSPKPTTQPILGQQL